MPQPRGGGGFRGRRPSLHTAVLVGPTAGSSTVLAGRVFPVRWQFEIRHICLDLPVIFAVDAEISFEAAPIPVHLHKFTARRFHIDRHGFPLVLPLQSRFNVHFSSESELIVAHLQEEAKGQLVGQGGGSLGEKREAFTVHFPASLRPLLQSSTARLLKAGLIEVSVRSFTQCNSLTAPPRCFFALGFALTQLDLYSTDLMSTR